ncbi:ybaK/ebsC protein [Melioribacter roseus P3M-2]|uniref:Cys-tRNA(Pro)/Cys-tRNA(Cys) deacylase n=1 Tax=Melioribacter roseus (strain DSM 23840 / JCM 17771 / VKM B-2668 / P3M-2) TaxID=1191523 RepID=I6Z4R4_MELRP|nr:Cys-tRNA(Pro) deacylase [Melioribacter roseus]AFN74135.1 ybaK/ebsC protein [Melioribacter roseus P3M-2]
MTAKTNALRLLDKLNVGYETAVYEFSEDEIDAVSVARKIGAEPERVFKTLVAKNESGDIFVFVIPGNCEIDLKKAASTAGVKKIELVKVKELQPLTGYIRGGCSPIGMKKQYATFIDETAQMWDKIYVSAGARGVQLLISPENLREITNAEFSELIK